MRRGFLLWGLLAQPVSGQEADRCRPLPAPDPLPTPGQLADLSNPATLQRQHAPIRLTLVFGPDGERLAMHDGTGTPDRSHPLVGLVRDEAAVERREAGWAVRLVDDGGGGLTVEPVLYCIPVVREAPPPRRITFTVTPGPGRTAPVEAESPDWVLLLIDAGGRVRRVWSDLGRVNDTDARYWRRVRFEPATADGVRVPAVIRHRTTPP